MSEQKTALTADVLEALGITKEAILEAVAKRAIDEMDAGDDEFFSQSLRDRVQNDVDKHIKEHIERAIASLFEQHVQPGIEARIEAMRLTRTNEWGEKKGSPMTFVEYLASRADAYMLEPVNYEGKARGNDSYWKADQSRLTWLINKKLESDVNQVVAAVMKGVTTTVAASITETVKLKLAEVSEKLKFEVTPKAR